MPAEVNATQPKLHFIHGLDNNNVGDWLASPLAYFADYFIGRYNVVYHNIVLIKWNEIATRDAIIIGGGGLLENSTELQERINRLLDVCDCVIGWGVGFHRRGQAPVLPEIDYSRFTLLAVRDYGHPAGLEYLPCVTCLLPQLRKKRERKREIGIINHTAFAINGTGLDTIDNSVGIDEMTEFIAESSAILTTSYHAAYWALLMGKKVIVALPWANKFEYFERKPVILSELSAQNFAGAIAAARSYDGWLDECVARNLEFFDRVKKTLENYIPVNFRAGTIVNLLRNQEWASTVQHMRINELAEQVRVLSDKIEQRLERLEKCK